jgi:transcriptional regulator with PAS, ATPase and Fis domain
MDETQQAYQPIMEAVAAVLKLDVTLVNDRLERTGGTGIYQLRVGEQVHPDSAFGQALRGARPVTVERPRHDAVCLGCGARSYCQETAHVATPIIDDGAVIGVLGLIAFTEQQREQLLHGLDAYVTFLARISELIAGRIRQEQTVTALLEARGSYLAVANSVAEGLIGVDSQGMVTFVNQRAHQLLHLSPEQSPTHIDQLGDLCALVAEVLIHGQPMLRRELKLAMPHGTVNVVAHFEPICVQGRTVGAVASLQDAREIYDLVYRMNADQPAVGFDRIIYRSPAMAAVVDHARRVAASSSTVLIRGESGTGKELFARAIHAASPRLERPFIAINCAAIPDDLLESELFGYADGAFTGARRGGKPGKFELAHRGTIFLDEIGDMSLRLQAKLLRVIQDGEVSRLGATQAVQFDVRIIAATNRNLEELIRQHEFREDLYFRINVIPLEIPPLRARSEDIPPVLEHVRLQRSQLLGKRLVGFDREASSLLARYPWPGNIRELENAVEYAVTMSTGPLIAPEHLPIRVREAGLLAPAPPVRDPQEALTPVEELVRAELQRGLARYGTGERAVVAIAKDLGLSRATVYRRLKEYGWVQGRQAAER